MSKTTATLSDGKGRTVDLDTPTEPGPIQTKITGCKVKGIKADMLEGRVSLTFETYLDREMLMAAQHLQLLASDEAAVDLTLVEQQMRLPFLSEATSS